MAKKDNKLEKVKMVKAMEYIVRQINNEDVFMGWLWGGVADGDIEYGDFDFTHIEEDEAYYYIQDDDNFADLMHTFLRCMVRAYNDGGLYCGGVVSKENKW